MSSAMCVKYNLLSHMSSLATAVSKPILATLAVWIAVVEKGVGRREVLVCCAD